MNTNARRTRAALATAVMQSFLLYMPTSIAAQSSVPTRDLGKLQVAFSQELSSVAGIRELSDGRVVVLDSRERTLHLFDPRTGGATRISREGAGPEEYQRPSRLVALAADTTLVHDSGNNRYLVLGASGSPIGTLPLTAIKPSPGVTYVVDINGVDASGRFYYTLPSGLVEDAAKGIPVLRYDRQTERSDTIGFIADVARQASVARRKERQVGATGGVGVTSSGGLTPFPANDDWSVSADGSVAFVRANPFHVEWRPASGFSVIGAVIPYQRVPVNEAEKEGWRTERRGRGAPRLRTTDASGKTTEQILPVAEPETWPEYKPPFLAPAAQIAPDGRVWVARSASVASKVIAYDIFDRAGRLVEHLTMPATSRIVGFGRNAVYVVRKDADDLLHLERYGLGG